MTDFNFYNYHNKLFNQKISNILNKCQFGGENNSVLPEKVVVKGDTTEPIDQEEIIKIIVKKDYESSEDSPNIEKVLVEYELENKIDFMEPSEFTKYTIREGTILFYGTTNKDVFDSKNIKLYPSFQSVEFSPNIKYAEDRIQGCANYPEEDGYIHTFVAKKDINNIIILSKYDINKDTTLHYYEKILCNSKNDFFGKINGIGIFFDNNNEPTSKSEFTICDPNEFLDYLYTRRCQSKRQLSYKYNFNIN